MSKVVFWCDSGANIKSKRSEVLDTLTDLGYEDDEWKDLSEFQKQKLAEKWAWNYLEIGYEEI